jgi:choline monooxygenase
MSDSLPVPEKIVHDAHRARCDFPPKNSYLSDIVLNAEIDRLYKAQWLFVGLTSELDRNNSFVTVDIPGISLVVHNFGGNLRAFQNICTHRFNKIQTEDRGRRPLMCGYHAWTFDQTGFPFGRSKREQFPADTVEERERLCLSNYPVEICGSFVFVNMYGSALPLREYLGDLCEDLETISAAMGNEIHYGSVPHLANWKLLVENVLECYHCTIVHPETFVAGLGIGNRAMEGLKSHNGHSSCHFPRTETKRENLRRRVLSHLNDRPFKHESFFHIYIFPNLFISSQEGLTFYVGQALPTSAEQTTLRTRVFEPKFSETPGTRQRQDVLNKQTVEIASRVINEDKPILEAVQRGVALSDKPGCLGFDEVRIDTFFKRYQDDMALGHA